MARRSPATAGRRRLSSDYLSLATGHCSLAESGHENIFVIDHTCVRDVYRDFLICAKPRHIPRECIGFDCGPTGNCERSAESAGDDETDDRDVEGQ